MLEVARFHCPMCGSYLGQFDGETISPPPCKCGWQTSYTKAGQEWRISSRYVKHGPQTRERLGASQARI